MQTLTQVLALFLKYLTPIPSNLKNVALGLLCIFTIIDISLEVFNLEETNWNKYIVKKTFRVGILMFLIIKWSWILDEINKGFLKIATIAINLNLTNESFITNPSKIVDIGLDMGIKF